jgi:hypothetical protein
MCLEVAMEILGTVETGCGKVWKWLWKVALEKSLWGAAARLWLWQRPWEWCAQMWQAVEYGCVCKWLWGAALRP